MTIDNRQHRWFGLSFFYHRWLDFDTIVTPMSLVYVNIEKKSVANIVSLVLNKNRKLQLNTPKCVSFNTKFVCIL